MSTPLVFVYIDKSYQNQIDKFIAFTKTLASNDLEKVKQWIFESLDNPRQFQLMVPQLDNPKALIRPEELAQACIIFWQHQGRNLLAARQQILEGHLDQFPCDEGYRFELFRELLKKISSTGAENLAFSRYCLGEAEGLSHASSPSFPNTDSLSVDLISSSCFLTKPTLKPESLNLLKQAIIEGRNLYAEQRLQELVLIPDVNKTDDHWREVALCLFYRLDAFQFKPHRYSDLQNILRQFQRVYEGFFQDDWGRTLSNLFNQKLALAYREFALMQGVELLMHVAENMQKNKSKHMVDKLNLLASLEMLADFYAKGKFSDLPNLDDGQVFANESASKKYCKKAIGFILDEMEGALHGHPIFREKFPNLLIKIFSLLKHLEITGSDSPTIIKLLSSMVDFFKVGGKLNHSFLHDIKQTYYHFKLCSESYLLQNEAIGLLAIRTILVYRDDGGLDEQNRTVYSKALTQIQKDFQQRLKYVKSRINDSKKIGFGFGLQLFRSESGDEDASEARATMTPPRFVGQLQNQQSTFSMANQIEIKDQKEVDVVAGLQDKAELCAAVKTMMYFENRESVWREKALDFLGNPRVLKLMQHITDSLNKRIQDASAEEGTSSAEKLFYSPQEADCAKDLDLLIDTAMVEPLTANPEESVLAHQEAESKSDGESSLTAAQRKGEEADARNPAAWGRGNQIPAFMKVFMIESLKAGLVQNVEGLLMAFLPSAYLPFTSIIDQMSASPEFRGVDFDQLAKTMVFNRGLNRETLLRQVLDRVRVVVVEGNSEQLSVRFLAALLKNLFMSGIINLLAYHENPQYALDFVDEPRRAVKTFMFEAEILVQGEVKDKALRNAEVVAKFRDAVVEGRGLAAEKELERLSHIEDKDKTLAKWREVMLYSFFKLEYLLLQSRALGKEKLEQKGLRNSRPSGSGEQAPENIQLLTLGESAVFQMGVLQNRQEYFEYINNLSTTMERAYRNIGSVANFWDDHLYCLLTQRIVFSSFGTMTSSVTEKLLLDLIKRIQDRGLLRFDVAKLNLATCHYALARFYALGSFSVDPGTLMASSALAESSEDQPILFSKIEYHCKEVFRILSLCQSPTLFSFRDLTVFRDSFKLLHDFHYDELGKKIYALALNFFNTDCQLEKGIDMAEMEKTRDKILKIPGPARGKLKEDFLWVCSAMGFVVMQGSARQYGSNRLEYLDHLDKLRGSFVERASYVSLPKLAGRGSAAALPSSPVLAFSDPAIASANAASTSNTSVGAGVAIGLTPASLGSSSQPTFHDGVSGSSPAL